MHKVLEDRDVMCIYMCVYFNIFWGVYMMP